MKAWIGDILDTDPKVMNRVDFSVGIIDPEVWMRDLRIRRLQLLYVVRTNLAPLHWTIDLQGGKSQGLKNRSPKGRLGVQVWRDEKIDRVTENQLDLEVKV